MRWFKHVSTAMDDLFVRDLERRFGDSGYAFWFKTLELIAAHGKDGVLTISWSNFGAKLNKRRDHLRRMLAFATQDGHLSYVEDSENFITITCVKFSEYADNYTKYGHSGKRLQRDFKETSNQEEEVEGEVEVEKKAVRATPVVPISAFEEVWNTYPNKSGRKAASRHWAASVKTPEDVAAIKKALTNYLASEKVRKGFIKNGSTWFNEWQDWVNVTPAMMGHKSNDDNPYYYDGIHKPKGAA